MKDNRPHDQRVAKPRKARRRNHSFQHLYRHDDPKHYDTFEDSSVLYNMSSKDYLVRYGGFDDVVVEQMNTTFPPLLDLDVIRHLRPKLRFLKYTLGGVQPQHEHEPPQHEHEHEEEEGSIGRRRIRQLSTNGKAAPAQYYGARLEKTIAPRHAFLMFMKLPNGPILLQNNAKLLNEFLVSSRKTKQFCALCNTWRRTYGIYHDPNSTPYEDNDDMEDDDMDLGSMAITPNQIIAFDALFQRGLMAAARDDMDISNYSKHVNITSGQMIHLLTQSGANPLDKDVRGVSLVHWAAGSGNTHGLKQLIRVVVPGGNIEEATTTMKADRDGATLLHWAAAGAKSKEFGCGGHIHICRFLLEGCSSSQQVKRLVNTCTKDGNSVLMWAAWSGTLDVVKLFVRHRADKDVQNRNGCTVAHWAASGGNLQLCRYLAYTVGVDFSVENYAGNTPLSHAVAYGRIDVVAWLRDELLVDDLDGRAKDLAADFVGWGGDTDRKKMFDLFQAWDGGDADGDGDGVTDESDDMDDLY